LIPNQKIYRKDPERYIYFNNETIANLAKDFINNGTLNTDHIGEDGTRGLNMAESWIQREDGEYPKGTWMMSIDVKDRDLLSKVRSGEYNGLSIESVLPEQTIIDITEDTEKLQRDAEALGEKEKSELFGQFINNNEYE